MTGASYCEGTVAAAIAKRRERMFYVSTSAVDAVAAYMATGRRAAVRRAQRASRYEVLRGKLVINRISSDARQRTQTPERDHRAQAKIEHLKTERDDYRTTSELARSTSSPSRTTTSARSCKDPAPAR